MFPTAELLHSADAELGQPGQKKNKKTSALRNAVLQKNDEDKMDI